MAIYKAIGVMSGTSLDGVDLAYVEFEEKEGEWSFNLISHESIRYSKGWECRLNDLMNTSALDFTKTHSDYGVFTGELLKSFIGKHGLNPDIIGVHGHTVFHRPDKGFTSQIGDGAAIAAITEQLIVCDFRSMDVARGGQGAPLVPIGDELLFSEFDARINIGGFANISFQTKDGLSAYDIAPANIVLNLVARKLGFEFDDQGKISKDGRVDTQLLKQLNALPYYQKKAPKSLGKEWVDKVLLPIVPTNISPSDLLRTYVEHIAEQISISLESLSTGRVLVTGGGALNTFLMEKIQEKTNLEIIVPKKKIIEMKEAIIFAFLAVLRLQNKINVLPQVTGASKPSISGALYDGRLVK